jgi:hypothetical protein
VLVRNFSCQRLSVFWIQDIGKKGLPSIFLLNISVMVRVASAQNIRQSDNVVLRFLVIN